MSHKWLTVLALLAAALSLSGQQPKKSASQATTAGGVFVGRSGKPMAGAKLILAEVREDAEVLQARVSLVSGVSTAVADGQGRFQIKGFTPGRYTLVYLPAGAEAVMTHEFSVKSLFAVTKSITPLLRNVELGKNEPYAQRSWGQQYTLLKGHTFYSEGTYMKIWNATLRRGQQGPYVEFRRCLLWTQRFDDNSQIKFDAWSF